jgi:hypothetical protein
VAKPSQTAIYFWYSVSLRKTYAQRSWEDYDDLGVGMEAGPEGGEEGGEEVRMFGGKVIFHEGDILFVNRGTVIQS